MYKIDYDHIKKQLDVQFILDLRNRPHASQKGAALKVSVSKVIRELTSVIHEYNYSAFTSIVINGRCSLWYQTRSEAFDKNHCDDLLMLDYDIIHREDHLLISKDYSVTIQTGNFTMADWRMQNVQYYLALRFIVDVGNIQCDKYAVVLVNRDVHIEGTFDV